MKINFLFFSFFYFLSVSANELTKYRINVNDVSILWPPALRIEDAKNLVGLNEIISEDLFHSTLEYATQIDQLDLLNGVNLFLPHEVKLISNWHITALRIDPCAPNNFKHVSGQESHSDCIQEIRFVAQPFTSADQFISYFDYALHLIFVVSQGDPQSSKNFITLTEDLNQLKQKNEVLGIVTTGRALSVHPGFNADHFAPDLKKIIMTHLHLSRLSKITFSGVDQKIRSWIFYQGLVSNNLFVPEPDPTLRQSSVGFITPEPIGQGGDLFPKPLNFNWSKLFTTEFLAPSISDFFVDGPIDLKKAASLKVENSTLITSQVFKIEDIIPALENPLVSNRTNTDCFSCHTSTSRAAQLNLNSSQNLFQYILKNENSSLEAVHINKSITNMRIFGWFGSIPSVSRRVIYESAESARLIEKILNEPRK